ncbi:MAG: hypothetical protein K2Y27_27860 [Xanthobacteraceae bacterium]|nr:hypothetical protein [Xanthobacteraceae bacterium]
MAGQGHPALEKLRAFLRGLKPGARALLIAELERGLLQGASPAGAELVLAELRRSLREGRTFAARFDDSARLFFQPLEPFLVDDIPEHRHRGRLARTALEPLWLWINNTLIPDDAKVYAELVDQAFLTGVPDRAEHAARDFQDRVLQRIQELLAGASDRDRGRLSVSLVTTRAVEDVQTLCGILRARDVLATLATQLPGYISVFAGPTLDTAKSQFDAALGRESDLFLYALVLLMSRLASPWQLIRLATKAADSDDTRRIAETPYVVTIDVVLEEIDRRVRELAGDLKSGRGIAVSALLKDIHDALRGLRSEIDLSPESSWARQLAVLHADIARLLSAEIELMPGRVRRLVRPRPSKEISPSSVLDPHEVDEAEALIVFVLTCRKYASELAINEVTQRTFNELQHLLDTGTRTLLDALRAAIPAERAFRLSQVDAAVRFCAKVFGKEYAALLTKAAEVAAQAEQRKVAHG